MWKKGLLWSAAVAAVAISACTSDDAVPRKDCLDSAGVVHKIGVDQVCCDGQGVAESDSNCGTCGNVCLNGNVCEAGSCVCKGTGSFCSETCISDDCVDLMTNPKHCGRVGNACEPGEVCSSGNCSTSCQGSLENCNGLCKDINSDVNNCGACGRTCPTADSAKHISSGFCQNQECRIVCETGWVDNDGDMSNGCELEVSFECGNNVVEMGEKCDGKRLNDQSCESLVGVGSTGTIVCLPDCMGFDTSDCTKSTTCGNGTIDGSETCDGRSLGSATCESVVGAGSTGYLACQDNCGGYDTEGCTAPTTCNNGALDPGEICDGALLNNATCESVVGAGSTGTLKCAANCADFDRSGCSSAAVCGDGVVAAKEECDRDKFNDMTCEKIVGAGSRGNLSCTSSCRIDSSNCSAASTCGNGVIDGRDVCDGSALNGKTCADVLGAGSTGRLGCKDNCAGYDISGCTAASTCGNGVIENGEACDGARLNDETCESQVGHGSTGKLRCNATCTGFVTDNCTASTTCGNGIIENGEVCDGARINGATCDSEVGPGSKGTVLCASDCKSLNLSGCSAATQCGNGTVDAGEVCEASDLKGASCASVVGAGSTGALKCGDGCKHFDTSACSPAQSCGDGNINEGETCDGNNLANRTCLDVVGYGSMGLLKCKPNCSGYDTSSCTPEVKCGNNKLDAGEICDGALLNGASCSALVGHGSTGTLKCNSSCSGYDTSSCSPEVKCGNGVLDSGEICDGSLLNGATCASVVGFGSTGTLKCNSSCTGYISSSCSKAVTCGNGDIDPGEFCDTTDMNGATCESVVGVGSTGTLLCDSTCKFNTTNCSASRGCGNGSIEDSEECDKTAFKNNVTTCTAYDGNTYSSGKLKCADNCMIDTSDCKSYCGNGSVNSSKGEVCDGTNLNSKTCAKIVGEGSTGELACSDDCKSFDTSGCSEPKFCGDGKINVSGEECDTNTFATGSNSCAVYSSTYESGELSCTSGCKVSVKNCVAKAYCGDGAVNNDEYCDGEKFLNGRTNCSTWNSDKYIDGKVSCNSDCTLNYSACVEKPTVKCGNGVIDDGEYCDQNAFIVDSCYDWSHTFSGGTLKCNTNCSIDDSSCTLAAPEPRCGDGNIDAGEECDSSSFPDNIKTCNGYDPYTYKSGSLSCSSSCKIDTSACKAFCGNGEVNSTYNGYTIGEKCDTAKAVTRSCATELGTGYSGTLKCAADCKSFDPSECVAPSCGDGTVNQTSENCDGSKFRNNKTTCVGWNSAAYSGGNVSCNSDCTINYDACEVKVEKICGDGLVNQTSEECDLNAFRNNVTTCAAYDPKYSSGNLKCTTGCKIDPSSCVLAPVTNCGNNVVDDDELCDGSKFFENITTCAEYNPNLYASGDLKCVSCDIDTSLCKLHRCGDNVVGPDEYCDGTNNINPLFYSCESINSMYTADSHPKCKSNCTLDTSTCVPKCGNHVLEANEYCDHSDQGDLFQSFMDSCDKWVPGSLGTLTCTSSCTIDYSACQTPPSVYCGDGTVNQASEKCDGGDFGAGNTNLCAAYSSAYISGTLGCNSDCTINTNSCVHKPVVVCGNGMLDDGEDCDGGVNPPVFMLDVDKCSDYSNAYGSGNLKCTSDCKYDLSECVRNCTEDDIRCVDSPVVALQMCVDGQWQNVDECNSSQICSLAAEKCIAKPDDFVDLQWCTFHWLETTGNHNGYGRILFPSGMSDSDVIAQMRCTNDLSKPVSEWDEVDANKNPSCSGCGNNTEYMTISAYAGKEGINYCTFTYFFNDASYFACRPQQEGAAAPINLNNNPILTADLTRQFTSTSCNNNAVRCSGNLLQICDYGEWETVETCASAENCDAANETCTSSGASFDILTTMNGWFIQNETSYSTSRPEGISPKITVTAAFYVSDKVIDDVTAVFNAKSPNNTQIVIDNIPSGAGIGYVSFKYKPWSNSEFPVIQVSDGTTTKTLNVNGTDQFVQTATFTFNNPAATSVTIKPVSTSSNARVLIDDIRYTSAY